MNEHIPPPLKIPSWAVFFIASNVVCHQVYESVEEDDDSYKNTTTLYPIEQHTQNRTTNEGSASKKNDTNVESTKLKRGKIKTSATIWKIDTAFAEPKVEDNNSTDSKEEPVIEKPEGDGKDFKPSPHLGSFLDLDSSEIPAKQPFGRHFANSIKKPPIGFKFPKEYKGSVKNDWKIGHPIATHAGDFYKSPEAFKHSQGSDQDNFQLDFKEERPLRVNKKPNPWQGLMRLVTAFLPIGLIISALTPSVVSVQPEAQPPPRLYRRRDVAGPSLNISDMCRRRLLCELYNDNIYLGKKSKKKPLPKNCSAIPCSDPAALEELATWMLETDSWPILQTTSGDFIT